MRNRLLDALCSSLLLSTLAFSPGCGAPSVKPPTAGQPAAHQGTAGAGPRAADPLAALAARFPDQRYITGRGQGATADAARAAARQRLLEGIQSRARAIGAAPEGAEQPVLEVAAFKHAALIKITDPVAAADGGGFVALAVLDRSEAAPFLEMEIRTAREKLEAWRKQMFEALRGKQQQRVIALCGEDPSPLLAALDELRLSLAVVQNDAESYKAHDDLKSVLELQIGARKLLAEMPTSVVLDGDAGDGQTAAKIADLVMKHVIAQGLKARLDKQAGADGIVLKVRPELEWTQDSFHFLRSGLTLQASFAGSPEAFLQLGVDGNRTKAGGVQKSHAQRDSLKKLDQILGEELKPRLPNLECRFAVQGGKG